MQENLAMLAVKCMTSKENKRFVDQMSSKNSRERDIQLLQYHALNTNFDMIYQRIYLRSLIT